MTRTHAGAGFLLGLVAAVAAAYGTDTNTGGAAPAVAHIGGMPITQEELDARTHDKMVQQQLKFDAQHRRLTLAAARERNDVMESELEAMIDDRVLQREAMARKVSAATLLAGVTVPPVSDAALHEFYAAQGAQLKQPFDVVKPQISQSLLSENTDAARARYVQSLRDKYEATVSFEPLREAVDEVGPKRGADDAPVTIVEFSDFQCPYCGRLAPVLTQLLAAYPHQVKLVFRNLPLRSMHANAAKAAEAALCAGAQGKFWEMHDALYANQTHLSPQALKSDAATIGLDATTFDQCLDTGSEQQVVEADEQAAVRLGLAGTPTAFVNGRFVDGAMPLYRWKELIDDELRRRKVAAGGAARGSKASAF